MKYIYFYSTANVDFEDNYAFGRYSYTTDKYAPVKCAYSDSLDGWEDQTPTDAPVPIPVGWFSSNPPATVQEFLLSSTTYTARSPKEFKTKYPEFFI